MSASDPKAPSKRRLKASLQHMQPEALDYGERMLEAVGLVAPPSPPLPTTASTEAACETDPAFSCSQAGHDDVLLQMNEDWYSFTSAPAAAPRRFLSPSSLSVLPSAPSIPAPLFGPAPIPAIAPFMPSRLAPPSCARANRTRSRQPTHAVRREELPKSPPRKRGRYAPPTDASENLALAGPADVVQGDPKVRSASTTYSSMLVPLSPYRPRGGRTYHATMDSDSASESEA